MLTGYARVTAWHRRIMVLCTRHVSRVHLQHQADFQTTFHIVSISGRRNPLQMVLKLPWLRVVTCLLGHPN